MKKLVDIPLVDRVGWITYLLARDCYQFKDKPFTLSSGKTSQHYVDCRKLSLHPDGIKHLASEICNRLPIREKLWVGGPSIGADPIVGATILYAGLIWNANVHGFLTRKEKKEHGLGEQIVGVSPHWDAKVVLIEDVLTTGASLQSTIDSLKSRKAFPEIVKAIVVVDRQEGGREMLEAQGIPVDAICTLEDIIAKKATLPR